MRAQEIIRTHPHVQGNTNDVLIRAIVECYDCAQTCLVCADACLGEDDVSQLTQCIRLNQDCADVCNATGMISSRRTGSDELLIRSMLESCALACRICGEECRRHGDAQEHCRICAEACSSCERACNDARQTI